MSRIFAFILVSLLIGSTAQATPVILAQTDFSTGLEGWDTESAGGATVSYRPTGGESGGFIEFDDLTGALPMTAVAPAAYLDWADHRQITLSFFHRVTDFGGWPATASPQVYLRSPSSRATFVFPSFGTSNWTQWSVSLTDQAGWTIDSGSWADLRANADFLGINMDITSGFDDSGLDTVLLTGVSAIPAPAVTALLLPALGFLRRR